MFQRLSDNILYSLSVRFFFPSYGSEICTPPTQMWACSEGPDWALDCWMCLEQGIRPTQERAIWVLCPICVLPVSCILSVAGQELEWSSKTSTHYNYWHVLSPYNIHGTVLSALYVTASPPATLSGTWCLSNLRSQGHRSYYLFSGT